MTKNTETCPNRSIWAKKKNDPSKIIGIQYNCLKLVLQAIKQLVSNEKGELLSNPIEVSIKIDTIYLVFRYFKIFSTQNLFNKEG